MELKNRALEFSVNVYADNPFLLDNFKERARKIGELGLKLASVSVPTYAVINAAFSYSIVNSLVDLVYSSIQRGL